MDDFLDKLKFTLNIDVEDIESPIYTLDLSKNSNYFILEVSSIPLNSFLNKELSVKGCANQSAVLCNEDFNYEMIQVCLTSTLICLPFITDGSLIRKSLVISDYIELKEYKPSLKQLYDILGHVLYVGEYNEGNYHQQQFYTTRDLLDLLRCTYPQFLNLTKSLDAFEYNKFWRMFDSEFIEDAVMHLCRTIESTNMSSNSVPRGLIFEDLSDLYNSEIIEAFMGIISTDIKQDGESIFYCLDCDKICKFGGLSILRRANQLIFDEFMAIWSRVMPFAVNIDQLKGVAVVGEETTPKTISLFDVLDLSENDSERYRQIFTKMKVWSQEQIIPYVNIHETDVISRFTRSFDRNGKTYYTSRMKLI